jgi:osmotically inducible lipoprotein OsmB
MHKTMMIGVVVLACAAAPAQAAGERTLTGVAIGAGAGALIAGPVGAVAGGVIGGVVGGPKFSRTSGKRCWYDRDGHRHCKYY